MTDKYYKDFGITPLDDNDKIALKRQQLYNLFKRPKKDKGLNMPKLPRVLPNLIHQADLLYLPHDGKYKYALVVVDIGSRMTDAVPLENRNAEHVLNAFKKIYGRNILSIPERLEVDSGSEFKGALKNYFVDKNITVRYGKPNRHRQQSLVERRNQQIANALFKRQTGQEILTGEKDTQWVKDLPTMIQGLNKRYKNMKMKPLPDIPVAEKDSMDILEIGTEVRAQLDEPISVTTGDREIGSFRSTDIRWNPEIRVIREILLRPGQPPMYLLDGSVGKHKFEPVGYTRNQLQVVPSDEQPPPLSVIRGEVKNWKIKKIIGKKGKGNNIKYNVLWVAGDTSWESRKKLLEDVPQMVQKYEDNLKNN